MQCLRTQCRATCECSGAFPVQARTYPDLLASPHDEALFEHYMTSEVVLVSVRAPCWVVGGSARSARKCASKALTQRMRCDD